MALHPTAVGVDLGAIEVVCDARWLMSFAAGVPDERSELYDTTALGVHPLFPVAPEWELVMAARGAYGGLEPDEVRRGIHVEHDLVLHRAVRAGERLRIAATVTSVGRRRAGATQTTRFTATDSHGEVVWRTAMGSLFLGVELVGEPTSVGPDCPDQPSPPVGAPIAERASFVRPIDAHVYTECARIWNPIHTDVVAARRAGLERPILHGTATLARGVSIATELADVPLTSVTRVIGRFGAMVDPGTTITVRLLGRDDHSLAFDVLTADGRVAVADGVLGF